MGNNSEMYSISSSEIIVPQVRYGGMSAGKRFQQMLVRLLMPTTSEAFTKKDEYFRQTFNHQVSDYNELRKRTKQLFLLSRSHRLSLQKEVIDQLNFGDAPDQWDDEIDHVQEILKENVSDPEKVTRIEGKLGITPQSRQYQVIDAVPSQSHINGLSERLSDREIDLLDRYCSSIKRTRLLRSHLEDIDKDLEGYAYLVKTQATAELTYFRGLRDWSESEVMLQLVDGLSSSLVAISTLGAGLVYSTVFGASRGDVAIMCYSFPLFVLGFLVPVVIQILLRWAASLQKEVKFASQQFWTIIIGILMSFSSIAVMAALTLLNLTIFFLRVDADTPGVSDPTSHIPGILSFSISGSVFVLILTGVLLSAIASRTFTTAKGVRAVVSAMYGSQSHHEDALKQYLPV